MKNMLKIWEPFQDLVRFDDEFERLYDSMVRRFFSPEWKTWLPPIDIAENNGSIEVRAEIPGVNKEDLKVTIEGDMLSITGERKKESETKDKKYHRIERYYGKFSRTINLPYPVEADKVKATYKDGILTITLPKPESAKTKEIEVEVK
jgi:HSP20 family protein|uniref:Hsp20/alpha crystallin family protein n=1 Tax=candidate division WOR-3 bacterium TaxID=2052148 RepID=A0A7V3RHR6_UNCW3